MISITEHIEFLVTRHDCVVIPGWGALVAQCEPACYDETRGEWQPPRRHIAFNASVNHNDGLLAQSIARCEQVSYDKAVWLIADAVSGFSRQLSSGQEVSLGRVGFFRRNGDGMEFVPFEHLMSVDMYYGLSPFAMPTLSQLRHAPAVSAESWRRRSVWGSRAVQIAASIVALIGMTVLLTTPRLADRSSQQAAVTPRVTVLPRQQSAAASPAATDFIRERAQQATQSAATAETGRYYLVICALKTDKEVARVRRFNPGIAERMQVVERGGYKCVAVARGNDKEALLDLRKDLPKICKNGWIVE